MNCLRMLIRHRRLFWNLILIEFKVRYAGSKAGMVWAVVAPLMILAAYLLVFGGILGIRPQQHASGLEYGLLIACGLLPWLGFSEGVTRGTASVLAQRNLMKSQLFPMELLPVTAVCAGLMTQLCGMAVLLVILGVCGTLGANLAVLPLLILFQLAFTLGVAWFLSCINILYRDTSQVASLVMVLLMFVSPIAYTLDMVPSRLEWVITFNPLAYLIEAYRATLLSRDWPNVWGIGAFAGLAMLLLFMGLRYIMRLRRLLPDFA
jgi:lipopolysaccharide transport system permease protein